MTALLPIGPSVPQTVHLNANENELLRFAAQLKATAGTWLPESPNLHELTTTLLEGEEQIDALRTTFGIRDFGYRISERKGDVFY